MRDDRRGILDRCSGSGGSGVPSTASSSSAAQSPFGQQNSSLALSGEYAGQLHATGADTIAAKLTLSQTQNALAGTLVVTPSEGGGLAVAWIANGKKISGTFVSAIPSAYCTFSVTGKYKNHKIRRSYSATHGCSSQSGTFTLLHECYFEGTGSEAIRPESGVKPC